MKFDEHARRQSQDLIDALTGHLEKAAGAQFEALRAEVDVRAAALKDALSTGDHSARLAKLLEELSAVAREDAETLAARARLDVEKSAKGKLAAARAEAAQHLAGVQREMAAEYAQLLLSQDELRTQLKAETQGRSDLASALEAARLEASLAKIDVAEQGENLELAAERIRTLEARLADAEADNNAQRQRRTDEDRNARILLLDTLRSAIQAIQRATTPNDILEILLEYFGHHFDEAAAFLLAGSGFRGWRARRLGATTDLTGMSDAIVPLLTRIAASREPLAIAATADVPLIGLAGRPVANAVALPLCVDGLVLAIVYAEDASNDGVGSSTVGLKAAEILVDQATRRLTKRTVTTDRAGQRHKIGPGPVDQPKAQPYSSPRQARRVKMQESVDVTLDGSASFLIDISSLGAQVLSPLALHPNGLVQMQLVGGETVIHCKGCVVWALFEQPQGTTAALYRAGIRFTEVDLPAVDSFLAMQGVPADVSLSQDALNMFGVRDSGGLSLHHGAKKSTAS